MARRRRNKGGKGGIWSIFGKVLPVLGFIDQVTVKEKASYQSLPTIDKLQAMVNNITGNMFGLNFFGGSIPQFTAKTNPAGIANKYTGIGLAGIALSFVNRSLPKGMKVPYLGRISSLAKRFLPAGIVGGFFDSPTNSYSGSNQTVNTNFTQRESPSVYG